MKRCEVLELYSDYLLTVSDPASATGLVAVSVADKIHGNFQSLSSLKLADGAAA